MKEGIHPDYHEVKITCTCGNEFVTKSTKKDLRLELCSECHPFFTGKQRFVDSAGRVERFQRKYAHLKDKKADKTAEEKTKKPSGKAEPKKKGTKKASSEGKKKAAAEKKTQTDKKEEE